jgi:hypothetical protein
MTRVNFSRHMRLLAISLYYLYELVILLFKVSEGNTLSLTFGCVVSVFFYERSASFENPLRSQYPL